jgi:hypothetical protein
MAQLYAGYSSLALLMQGAGSAGSTVFTDVGPDAIAFPTKVGSPVISTTQSKFGGSSLYFPGASYISTGAVSLSKMAFGTGAWRIGFWLRLNSIAGSQGIFSIQFAGGALSAYVNASGALVVLPGIGGSAGTSANSLITANTWHYIAMGRISNGYVYTYINGGSVFLASVGTTPAYPAATSVALGSDLSAPMAGYIDDFYVEPAVNVNTIIPVDTWVPRAPLISGKVTDVSGANASRNLFAYSGTTVVGATVSNGTTGDYTMNVSSITPVTVVAVPQNGESLNALVRHNITPG